MSKKGGMRQRPWVVIGRSNEHEWNGRVGRRFATEAAARAFEEQVRGEWYEVRVLHNPVPRPEPRSMTTHTHDFRLPSNDHLERGETRLRCKCGEWQPEPVVRHRHRWVVSNINGMTFCNSCLLIKDEARSRRGKTARQRGNAYERSVAARLGLKRVGHFGSTVDVGGGGEWLAAQVKNGGAFPERLWRWLESLPKDTLRAVVIGDAPGAGKRRREVIVLDFGEFCEWFGDRGGTT